MDTIVFFAKLNNRIGMASGVDDCKVLVKKSNDEVVVLFTFRFFVSAFRGGGQ